MLKPEELKERIRDIIVEVGEVDDVPDGKAFRELGIDSMMALEIVSEVERTFKVSVPEEELAGLTDLNKVHALVQRKLGEVAA